MSKSKITMLQDYLVEKDIGLNRNEITLDIEYSRGIEVGMLNENTLFCNLDIAEINIGMNYITAFLLSDLIETNNPFMEYFDKVEGLYNEEIDGDLIDLLASYIGAKDQERFNSSFKKMLVRTIASALDNSVFNKHIFVLVQAEQNSGKTSFLRWLVPPDLAKYYQENIETNKDGEIALAENFIVNYDELASFQKREINALKSFISKDYIKVRPPYLRKPIRVPRRANFVGSTNLTTFLNDPTGSVRWICHEINNINWAYKTDFKIDEIWSQAYELYKSGFPYQLTKDEVEGNEIANSSFQISTPEAELISKHFYPGSEDDYHMFLNATEVYRIIKVLYSAIFNVSVSQIGRALSSQGFIQHSKYKADMGYTEKGYYINFQDEVKLEQVKNLLI
jgi:predicted P-loop ATPase